MTGSFYLDWAVLAVSLFNMTLQLWLGLSVLLNADRRPAGLWLGALSLLAGGVFFISHTAIVGLGLDTLGPGIDFWWHAGWLPVTALPGAWYAVTLWYAGYWDAATSPLRRRHRFLWVGAVGLTVLVASLLVFANPLPGFTQAARFSTTDSGGRLPALLFLYPLTSLLCIAASLDALRQPGPTARLMGEHARRRARPWLSAAALTLLAVSLAVAVVMFGVVTTARGRTVAELYRELAPALGAIDLVLSLLIAAATIFVGQAVVAYEVFTGESLPRRSLGESWHGALLLAAGCGVLLGWSLTVQLRPLYSLLLLTVLLTGLFALFGRRARAERERLVHQLRPFAASERLYEQLLNPTAPSVAPAPAVFSALCSEVLATSRAHLIPFGPLTALVTAGLHYPVDSRTETINLSALKEILGARAEPAVPVDPARCGGAAWAVALWSDRALAGVLLLGERADGGLYAVEDIEIARAAGERLLDALAGSELARRLVALQRLRLAESQVLDQRARRALHDDALPQLHAALLEINAGHSAQAAALLSETHRRLADLLRELPGASGPEIARHGVIGALRRAADGELTGAVDSVKWEIDAPAETLARALPSASADVVFHAVREALRNAARHARGGDAARPLHVWVQAAGSDDLRLTVEDDGVGPQGAADSPGAQQGLALHATLLAVVGGRLTIEPRPAGGTRVTVTLPRLDS